MVIQPDRHALLKYGSLSFIVVQNTTLILVGVHSRRQEGPQYLGSVAVLLTEVLKTLISLTCALIDSGSGVLSELRGYVVHDPLWVLAFALPSLCYCVHNNLWYVAVTHLDPVTIAVMTQLKIVMAALFSTSPAMASASSTRCSMLSTISSSRHAPPSTTHGSRSPDRCS